MPTDTSHPAGADVPAHTPAEHDTHPGSQPALQVHDLVYSYGERRALDGVSFDVAPGEIFGLLGPNGSGKTTLFSILSTLKRPQGGSAHIFGLDVTGAADRVRAVLGVAFQHPSIDPQLTCTENLHHQGHLYGQRGSALATRSAELLERFGLADRAGDRAGTLSGGMQRRLELAKTLLHQPRILVLDEPATGLDVSARGLLWEDLKRLQGEMGVTIVLTTHLMQEADRCDRLAVMNRGKIAVIGSPAALKDEIGGEVLHIEAESPDVLAVDIQKRFGHEVTAVDGEVRLEDARAHRLVPELIEAFPGRVRSVRISPPTLEDVFLHATGHTFHEEESDSPANGKSA